MIWSSRFVWPPPQVEPTWVGPLIAPVVDHQLPPHAASPALARASMRKWRRALARLAADNPFSVMLKSFVRPQLDQTAAAAEGASGLLEAAMRPQASLHAFEGT